MLESESSALTAWRYPYGKSGEPLFNGVNSGTRTHDLQGHNLALYQLSYIHHKSANSIIVWCARATNKPSADSSFLGHPHWRAPFGEPHYHAEALKTLHWELFRDVPVRVLNYTPAITGQKSHLSSPLVHPEGLEPPTFTLEGCCSILLSYGCIIVRFTLIKRIRHLKITRCLFIITQF